MTTLEEMLQAKLIEEIFPSFSEDHKKHLNLLIRLIIADWLTQKLHTFYINTTPDDVIQQLLEGAK